MRSTYFICTRQTLQRRKVFPNFEQEILLLPFGYLSANFHFECRVKNKSHFCFFEENHSPDLFSNNWAQKFANDMLHDVIVNCYICLPNPVRSKHSHKIATKIFIECKKFVCTITMRMFYVHGVSFRFIWSVWFYQSTLTVKMTKINYSDNTENHLSDCGSV